MGSPETSPLAIQSSTAARLAHIRWPWEMMASAGSWTSARPSPLPSRPYWSQVPGMNCEIPCAPAGEWALGFQPDSASICAAMRLGVIPSQISPAAWTNSAYSEGTFLDIPLEFSILSDCPPIMAMASGISNRKPTTATATFELIVPPPTGWDWYTSSAGVR